MGWLHVKTNYCLIFFKGSYWGDGDDGIGGSEGGGLQNNSLSKNVKDKLDTYNSVNKYVR